MMELRYLPTSQFYNPCEQVINTGHQNYLNSKYSAIANLQHNQSKQSDMYTTSCSKTIYFFSYITMYAQTTCLPFPLLHLCTLIMHTFHGSRYLAPGCDA